MMTPIELLIAQLQREYNEEPNQGTLYAIRVANESLTLEKLHMKTAYLSGSIAISDGSNVPFEEYYTNQYTKP